MVMPDPTIPAIAELIGLGQRFVLWKAVKDRQTGKVRKVPYQARNGKPASSTDPTTWADWDTCREARRRHRAAGLGPVFNGDGVGGADLDTCRDPVTATVDDWAMRWVREINSYTEVSPSGTGLKIYFKVDPAPALRASKRTVGEGANGGDHAPAVELYLTGRYFALTGQHLEGTPDELTDATPAIERLAAWIAEGGGGGPSVAADLPPPLAAAIDADPKLKAAWASGEKLTRGGDQTRSGVEFSLVLHLARRGWSDELIELAIRHYPHGQFQGGALNERNAERRMSKLLRDAAKAREREAAWQESRAWRDQLLLTEKGAPAAVMANVATILRLHPDFAGRLCFDELALRATCRDMPWRKGSAWRDWTDVDDIALAEWAQRAGVMVKPSACADAVAVVASENPRHPVRAWLDGLVWDGTPRLNSWLADYLGAKAEEGSTREKYLQAVGRAWPIAGVARAFRPGCKADHALILEGVQRAGKSSAIAALVPDEAWFTDGVADLGTKDSAQDLAGKWLIELGELSACSRSDLDRIKNFMTKRHDHYRPSYGRRSADFPRQCLFAGTVNHDTYLVDETGNRRWWPVKVGKIDLEALIRDRDQLWAEAVHAYRAGERWWLEPALEEAAAEEQAERRIVDPWEPDLLDWAERRIKAAKPQPITIGDALGGLNVPIERRDQAAANRVARIFKANGWHRVRRQVGEARIWAYELVSQSESPSQSEAPPTGTDLASSSAVCPSSPSSPSSSEHLVQHPHPNGGGGGGGVGVPPEASPDLGGQTGTGTRTGTPRGTPPWHFDPAWSPRLLQARSREDKLDVVQAWLAEAGGWLSGDQAQLPGDLPDCLARRELLRHCKNLGVQVSMGHRA
jgi:predicted P-loop ATPase